MRPTNPRVITAADFSPAQPSSSPSSSDASDDYDRQSVSTILPPSRRSSVTTRRTSAADSSLSWLAHRGEAGGQGNSSTSNHNDDGNGARRASEVEYARDLFAPAVTAAAVPPTPPPSWPQQQQLNNTVPWQLHASRDEDGHRTSDTAATAMGRLSNTSPSSFRDPFSEFHGEAAVEPGSALTTPTPLSTTAPNNNNSSNVETGDTASVPASLPRYRFGDAQLSSVPASAVANRTPLDATVSAPPPPEESLTRSSRVSSNQPPSSSSQQQQQQQQRRWEFEIDHTDPDADSRYQSHLIDSERAAASAMAHQNVVVREEVSPPPFFGAPGAYPNHTSNSNNNSTSDDGAAAPSIATPTHTQASVVAVPAVVTPHVRFSSDLDVVEAASRASTSTTTTGIAAPLADTRHAETEMYEIDASDEADSNLGNTVNSLRSDGGSTTNSGHRRSPTSDGNNNNSSGSGSGGRHGHGRSPERDGTTDAHALPLLLTPDELQLERLKSYDQAARRASDSYPSAVDHFAAGHHNDSEDSGEPRDVDVDGDSGGDTSTRQRSPPHSSSSTATATTATRVEDDSDVTTLDFLRDTTTTLLPDAFTSMFATTTNFLKTKTDAMVNAVPQPIRRAMSRTGEGIASAADVTGMMLSNVGAYAMRGVPDRVMSPEWKYLIFVDAVNVLKCSLNVNILVAPYIFRMAGLVGGVLLILVMQVVCCYYTEVYFKAKGELKGAGHVIMYGDVPRITFGRWYPTFQLWYEGIALVATVAYAALNMQALLPHMKITGNAAKALSFIIPSLFCLPFAFMKRARTQPPMMTLASLLVFVSLVMMFTVFPYGNVVSATLNTIEKRGDSSLAVLHLFPQSAQEFFVAVSICVFTLTPLSRAVPVERTMQPRRYVKLLRICVAISTVVYVAFGVCAIVSYGSKTCSVLSTSFNNHHTSVEIAVMSLLFFAFLFYIPLNMFELGELCDRRMLGWRSIPRYGEPGPNMLRLLFLIGSALIAWCIPYYGLLISLSGCLGYSVVAIIVPAALDYVCRARYGLLRGRTLRFLDYVITFSGATLGGIVCIVGVVMTSYEIWLVVESGYSTTC